MSDSNALDRIHMQIMWDRLLAIVEEQAQTLIRTAFSTTVREAGAVKNHLPDRIPGMVSMLWMFRLSPRFL